MWLDVVMFSFYYNFVRLHLETSIVISRLTLDCLNKLSDRYQSDNFDDNNNPFDSLAWGSLYDKSFQVYFPIAYDDYWYNIRTKWVNCVVWLYHKYGASICGTT